MSARILLLASLSLALSCSGSTERDRWVDQLEPSGPCWNTDLSDGLSETSADELHSLYECLNQRGELNDLSVVDQSLDAISRSDRPIGAELGIGINRSSEVNVDILGMGQPILELLREDDLLLEWLFVFVEIVHGQSWDSIAEAPEQVAPASEGALAPLLTSLQALSSAQLDSETDLLSMLGAGIQSARCLI